MDSASVNFLTTKLIIEADEAAAGDLDAAVRKIVRKVEPDVTVREIAK